MADDNILRVGAEFDVGPLVSGANQAGTAVDNLKAKFQQIAVQAEAAGQTILAQAARMQAQGFSADEAASALRNLGVAEEEAATAAASAASAAGVEAPALESVAAAATNAGTALSGMGEKSAIARVGLAEATGSVGAMTFGLARLAAMSETIGPLLQAAFTPIIAVALAEIVVQLADKMATLYENIVLDKEEMDALNKIETTLTETTAKLAKETENAYIAYLKTVDPVEAAREKLRSLSSETFSFKIDDKTLKAIPDVVTEAGLHYRDFVKSLQEFPASEIDQKIQTVATVIKLVQDRLAAPVLRGPLDRTELEGELKLLQSIQAAMQQFADLNANQAKGAGADIGKAQEEQAKKAEEAAKREEEAAKKAAAEQARLQRERVEGYRKMQEDIAKARIPVEDSSLFVNGLPNEDLFANYYAKLGDDARAGLAAIREAEVQNGQEIDNILLKDLGWREDQWRRSAERMAAETRKANAEVARENRRVAEELTRDFSRSFDDVIRGTETLKFAFIKLGGDLVLNMIHSLEQMVLRWAVAQLQMTIAHATAKESQVATDAGAAAQTKTIEAGTALSSIGKSAAKAAAAAYAAVSEIPVVGPFLAPAAAAAAFTGVLAFEALASAEQGAIIPRNMPVNLHEGEMVLPPKISSAVQNMAAAGAVAGGGGTSISIHALDAGSVRDFLHRNQKQFVSQVKGAIRNRRF